jgi:hypothetical protein
MGGGEYGQRPERVSTEAGAKGRQAQTVIGDRQTDGGRRTDDERRSGNNGAQHKSQQADSNDDE